MRQVTGVRDGKHQGDGDVVENIRKIGVRSVESLLNSANLAT